MEYRHSNHCCGLRGLVFGLRRLLNYANAFNGDPLFYYWFLVC